MNWTIDVGEGDIGVYVWFGTPTMHKISVFDLDILWNIVSSTKQCYEFE